MATATLFNYMDLLRQGGFTEEQSKAQARALEAVLTDVKQDVKQDVTQEINLHDTATKGDVHALKGDVLAIKDDIHRIELAIEKVRYDGLKFTIWTGVAVIASVFGMLAKGFHWF